ncbi:MAG TPA: copper resistance CopC family protein [Acidobacteriaceae bacterium]|nr:copper resistance CopC family protein [Acidobacteriaceae bacterium]
MTAKRVVPALLLGCFVLALPRLALAHALLESSTPVAHATVHGPNVVIELRFNSRVDSQHSTLSIEAAGGSGPAEMVRDAQHTETSLNGHATLRPGNYVIQWQALSTDGHITRGEIPFSVQ